jgi:hypothetical protein
MGKEIILKFSEIDYEIQNVTYEYNEDDDNYPFCVSAQVFVPEHQGVLTATFNIDYVLETAEKHNPGMVRYVRTMIESYKEESFWDRLAFEALEEEGFDLAQLMDYSIKELQVKITETDG